MNRQFTQEAVMAKRHKVWLSVAAVFMLTVLILGWIYLLHPAMKIKQMEGLQSVPGPTAPYQEYLPETEEMMSWVLDLTELGPRKVGTENGYAAQAYVVDKLEAFGLENVEIFESDSTLWECTDWSLAVNGETIPSYFMAHTFHGGAYGSFDTPDGGLQAEVVYVGEGSESDFRKVDVCGKIVMADVRFLSVPVSLARLLSYTYYDPDHTFGLFDSRLNPYSPNTYPYNYFRAMENGAVGFIGVLSDYIDSNEYNNEDYAYLGDPMRLPGLWLTAKDAEQVKSLIAGGQNHAVLDMHVTNTAVKAGGVTGILPGCSDETILVHSHYDSSTPGAVEDASGTSVVLAIAKMLAGIPQEERQRTLRFVLMDTHFADYETHEAFNDQYLYNGHQVLADVCIEHIAQEMDQSGALTGLPEVRLVFASDVDSLVQITSEEIVRHRLARTVVIPADTFGDDPPTDATLVLSAGVPIISVISGPIYLYDNMDTVDKVAVDELRPMAETYADIIWRLMELDRDEFREK